MVPPVGVDPTSLRLKGVGSTVEHYRGIASDHSESNRDLLVISQPGRTAYPMTRETPTRGSSAAPYLPSGRGARNRDRTCGIQRVVLALYR